ncbi:MAG: DUF3616 domain-containing protein [Zavarzinella sp.]
MSWIFVLTKPAWNNVGAFWHGYRFIRGGPAEFRPTAARKISRQGNRLRALLAEDPILQPYCHLSAKANGLVVEGIAVMGDAIFFGQRSPVLNLQVVVEVKLETHRHDASLMSL